MRKHTDEEEKEDTKHWEVLIYRLLTVVSKTDNRMGQKQYLKRHWEFSETASFKSKDILNKWGYLNKWGFLLYLILYGSNKCWRDNRHSALPKQFSNQKCSSLKHIKHTKILKTRRYDPDLVETIIIIFFTQNLKLYLGIWWNE